MADLLNKNTPETGAPEADKKLDKAKKEKPAKKTYLEPNNMNFLERYEVVVEGKKADLDLSAYRTPILVAGIALLVILVIAQGLNILTKTQIKSLNKYINDPTNVSAFNEATGVKAKVNDAVTQKSNLEAMIEAVKTYPDVDKAFFDAIFAAGTANTVTTGNYGYMSNTGTITIACHSQAIPNISEFVRSLEATGLFTSVEYVGFSGAADTGYSFNVSCLCKGGK